MPDWSWAHAELRCPGVTLALLWQEYRLAHPQGFQYSWFCEHYRLWAAKVDVVMRQEHRAGEKLFVDYAGQTAPIIDRQTGEIRQAQIFVAVLGASSYTFAEATWSQKLPDWLGSHARCFAFFGGTSQILVPDNLRSGVTKAHRYEPGINPSYRDLAEHYGVAVLPARSRKPKDKAKVEVGVQVVERWILAVLRKPPVLLARRTQHGNQPAARTPQSKALQEAARLTPLGLRDHRPTRTATATRTSVCLRRMEKGAGAHRLSRRGRGPLLLGAVPAGEAPTRSAANR
ncbi:hypothetical protein L1887_58342 [Cichorium endivia]|nr:hypothetical protein L1887_58342 [Cichorium endivia]